MKIKHIVTTGVGIISIMTGCASNPRALAPVGPAADSRVSPGTNGYLQVFSETQKSPPIASDDPTYFNLHTGYDINDAAGKSVKYVPNHASNMDEWPDQVKLPAGNYNIVAKSSSYGLVTVPVIIEAGKTTVVRLDGN
jgi:hypothetical protein